MIFNDAFREQEKSCSFFVVLARRETEPFQETGGFEFFPQNLLTVRNLRDKVGLLALNKKQSDVLLLYDKADADWFASDAKKFVAR
jgi:hypothetical protein